jgi:hypothetical protein
MVDIMWLAKDATRYGAVKTRVNSTAYGSASTKEEEIQHLRFLITSCLQTFARSVSVNTNEGKRPGSARSFSLAGRMPCMDCPRGGRNSCLTPSTMNKLFQDIAMFDLNSFSHLPIPSLAGYYEPAVMPIVIQKYAICCTPYLHRGSYVLV